jgi:predicted dehydrogenase
VEILPPPKKHKKHTVALIGFGYWGPVLARVISQSRDFYLHTIVDRDISKEAVVSAQYPNVLWCNEVDEIKFDKIDFAFIATPAKSHFELAEFLLNNNLNVWIEKPACTSLAEAQSLVDLAFEKQLLIVVDHPYVFHPAVKEIKDLIQSYKLGDIFYYESSRANLGIFQYDVDVLWDLVVHDISIISELFPNLEPEVKSAFAHNPLAKFGSNASMVSVQLLYPNGMMASIAANWLSPIKIRRTVIGGEKATVIFDDSEVIEKVKVYDQEFTKNQPFEMTQDMQVGFRSGDINIPRLSSRETLVIAMEHLADTLQNGVDYPNELSRQLQVIQILENIQLRIGKGE